MEAELFSESNVLLIEINSDEQFFEMFERVHDTAVRALQEASTATTTQQQEKDGASDGAFKRPRRPDTPPREKGMEQTSGASTEGRRWDAPRKRRTKGKGAQERRRERRRQHNRDPIHVARPVEHYEGGVPERRPEPWRRRDITVEESLRRRANLRRLFGE